MPRIRKIATSDPHLDASLMFYPKFLEITSNILTYSSRSRHDISSSF